MDELEECPPTPRFEGTGDYAGEWDYRKKDMSKIGARVTILLGDYTGKQGTVYDHLPNTKWPWHVRPDGWPTDGAGMALSDDEVSFNEAAG